MKVNIPRRKYYSAYDTARWITHVVDYYVYPYKDYDAQREHSYKISDFLKKVPFFVDVCEVMNVFRKYSKIEIEDHDVWSLDTTLAEIIYPALLKIKKDRIGVPYVDDEDYPGDILISDDVDDNDLEFKALQIKWEYVLDEMIWTFKTIRNDFDYNVEEDYHRHSVENQERVNNGLRLFGKYYQALWT